MPDHVYGVDAILLSLGKWGKWQIRQCLWLSLTYIPLAFQYVSIVFIGHQPKNSCTVSGNLSREMVTTENRTVLEEQYVESENWNHSAPCIHGFSFDCTTDAISIATEWNLVCDSAYLVQLSQTIFTVGMAIGHMLLPVTDRFGRKRTLVVCHSIFLVVSLVLAFSPNIIFFCVIRFLLGCLFPVMNIAHCVHELELFPTKQRSTVTMSCKLFWATSIMLLTLLAYLFRNSNWRFLQLALSIPSLIVILQFWLIDESVRWLFVMNRTKDAIRILTKAAKINGIDYQPLRELVQSFVYETHPTLCIEQESTEKNGTQSKYFQQRSATEPIQSSFSITDNMENDSSNLKCDSSLYRNSLESEQSGKKTSNKMSSKNNEELTHSSADQMTVASPKRRQTVFDGKLLEIFKHKTLRKYVIICTYMMTVDVFLYYGLLLLSPSLAGDRFLNMLLNGAVEIPGYFLCIWTLNRFNRRTCIFGFHVFSGGALVIATILDTTGGPPLLVTALATLGKLGSSGTLMITFLYSSEILPTNIRGLGIGVMGTVAHIGALMAPFSSYLGEIGVWIPGSIFSVCCFSVCSLLMFLPETRGRQLPQTADDLKLWQKSYSKDEVA